jgi:hypothetical protein
VDNGETSQPILIIDSNKESFPGYFKKILAFGLQEDGLRFIEYIQMVSTYFKLST